MERLSVNDIVPGLVIFARVSTFPWWPAIIGRCPTTSEWDDNYQRKWVFFFNDDTGAWLRIRDMRPFTHADRQALTEINRLNPRHHRYLERIEEACRLAYEYMHQSPAIRPLSQYNARLTRAALQITCPHAVDDANVETPNIATIDLQAKRRSFPQESTVKSTPTPPLVDDNLPQGSSAQAAKGPGIETNTTSAPVGITLNADENGVNLEDPPRWKRKKSTIYRDIVDSFEPRLGNDKKTAESGAEETILSGQDRFHQPASTRSDGSIGKRGRASENKSEPSIFPTGRGQAGNNAERASTCSVEQYTADGGALNVSTEGQTIIPAGRIRQSSLEAHLVKALTPPEPGPDVTNLLHRQRLSGNHEDHRDAEISNQRRAGRNEICNSQIPALSSAAPGKRERTPSSVSEGRENVHHAGSRTVRSDAITTEAMVNGIHSPSQWTQAVANSGSVHGLQNRVNALESHVRSLQAQNGAEYNAHLVEDRAAAVMKTAVEALAKATEDFAQTRRYDTGWISHDIDKLWGQAKVDGNSGRARATSAEQSFAQSFGRSLVWTAWKRRRRF